MQPIAFPEQNVIFAENQPQYRQLPAHTDGHRVTACWSLTWRERLTILWNGRIWHQVLTFGNPLQPQLLLADQPELDVSQTGNKARA